MSSKPSVVPQPYGTTEPLGARIVARSRRGLVFLTLKEVWAFEMKERLCFVHSKQGRFDIDLSLKELEASPLAGSLLRVHRKWLANTAKVRRLDFLDTNCWVWLGEDAVEGGLGVRVPVSRSLARAVRKRLLSGTIGIRAVAMRHRRADIWAETSASTFGALG